jgi:hypothetical protein
MNSDVSRVAWAARLRLSEIAAVARLRLRDDIRAHIESDQLWLRGDHLDEELDSALQYLAPSRRFTVAHDGALTPDGHLLPTEQLPPGEWSLLDELIEPRAPVAALAGAAPAPVQLQLIRNCGEKTATWLLTPLRLLAAYAESAPEVRLRALSFAATADHALVQGTPLPPLPGKYLYEDAGLIIPCGWTWSPAVDATTVRAVLRLALDELALFSDDGAWLRIDQSAFVQARRSAIRLTARGTP